MRYTFADCELDTQLYTLHRAGQARLLRPKVFYVLLYLVENRHRVVPKQELLAHVWPEHFISDATLENCIKEVRQAIGDSGRAQRLLHTLRGYGYRFAAAIASQDRAQQDSETSSTARLGPCPAPDTAQQLPLAGRAVSPLATCSPPVYDGVPGPSLQHTAGAADGGLETDARGEEVSLQRGAPASTEEWKLVTVLCCALAEPPLGAPLELEPYYTALHALAALAYEAVQRYGGTLQPVVGEQLLAVFGVPLAQEDHARCAVLAALDLQQHLRTPALGAGLAVSMGIHTGPVVMGTLGSAAHGHVTAVGTPTQGALRLQQQAAPGMLLVSAATYHLVQEEVRGEPCGHLALDARQTPLQVYTVQGLRQRRAGVPQRAPRARSPFVGRQQELALLHDRLEAVRTGACQVVSLVGPPGMGKTRLLTEFRHGLAPDQVTWVLGQCLAYSQTTPYLPVRAIVQYVCTLTEGDSMETRLAAVRRRLAALGSVTEEDVALVLQLLDLSVAPALLTRLTPEARQARTFALLGHLLRHEAQRQPLVLAIEDVHWMDPTSTAWLASLVEGLAGAAVLLLVTARSGYPAPWGAHAPVTQLALPPLRAEDSQVILAAVPGTTQLPRALCRQIVAYGAGNPFFVEELAWHAVEHGLSATPVPVPETVHAVLAARIDRLPAVEKRLLQTAAVIGPQVPLRVLHAMAELSEDALEQGLTHLQSADFLSETRLVPERVYTFKHALTHEVAYHSLLLEQRRGLHARIVAALEAVSTDRLSEQVDQLAYHAFRGKVWEKAVRYGHQAGAKAAGHLAYPEAVTYFEQALAALRHLSENRKLLAHAIDIRLDLRRPLARLRESRRQLTYLREADALAAALGDSGRQAQAVTYLADCLRAMGDYDQALVAAYRALPLAMAAGDVVVQAMTYEHLGTIYAARGDYPRAMDFLTQSVVALDGVRPHGAARMARAATVESRTRLLLCLAEVGAFAEAVPVGADGLRLAEALDHPVSLARAWYGVGFVSLCQGNLARAMLLLERGLALCDTWHIRDWWLVHAAALGSAYALSGRACEALPLLEQVVEHDTRHSTSPSADWCARLSEGYMLAGRLTQALPLAHQALAQARHRQERGYEAWGLRLVGDLSRHHVPPAVEPAAHHYHQALALAEALGMRPLQAHCHRGLGLLYATTGQQEQARAALAAAVDLYRTMEMTLWLPETEAALAQVAGC